MYRGKMLVHVISKNVFICCRDCTNQIGFNHTCKSKTKKKRLRRSARAIEKRIWKKEI